MNLSRPLIKVAIYNSNSDILQFFQSTLYSLNYVQLTCWADQSQILNNDRLNDFDVIFLEYSSPELFEILKVCKEKKVHIQLVVLFEESNMEIIEKCFQFGITGALLLEDLSSLEMFINVISKGGIIISPFVIKSTIWKLNPKIGFNVKKLKIVNLSEEGKELICLSINENQIQNTKLLNEVYRFFNVSLRYKTRLIEQNEIKRAYHTLTELY